MKKVNQYLSFVVNHMLLNGNGILVDDNCFASCCWLLLRSTVIKKMNVEDKYKSCNFGRDGGFENLEDEKL
jgi:hypothetical protein